MFLWTPFWMTNVFRFTVRANCDDCMNNAVNKQNIYFMWKHVGIKEIDFSDVWRLSERYFDKHESEQTENVYNAADRVFRFVGSNKDMEIVANAYGYKYVNNED